MLFQPPISGAGKVACAQLRLLILPFGWFRNAGELTTDNGSCSRYLRSQRRVRGGFAPHFPLAPETSGNRRSSRSSIVTKTV
jgi:hypothetical protein